MAKRKRHLTKKQIEKLKSFSKRGYAPIEKAEKKIKQRLGFQARKEKTTTKVYLDKDGKQITEKTISPVKQRLESYKKVRKREKASRGILTAMGVIQGQSQKSGAGRPAGSYKHGMPIEVYRKNQRAKKALFQQYQQRQYSKYKTKGFTPEQIQQLQQQQTLEELEQPSNRLQQLERLKQIQRPQQQEQPKRRYVKMRVPTNMHNRLIQPSPSVADEELRFRKWSAETSITPNTQRILDQIKRIQNKGKRDNIEQQRRLREMNMVRKSMSMTQAHTNMIDTSLDFSGVDEDNILNAPSLFKENSEDNILRNDRPNILQTKETGNSLFF